MKTSHTMALLLAGLAVAVPARATTFTFDGVASGRSANSLSQAGITFQAGILLPDTNAEGLDVPGTEKWRVDFSAPSVTVDNPGLFGRGTTPSGGNALNALFQPVIVLYPGSSGFSRCSATLDNDTFGDANLTVGFYDSNDRLIASVRADQTVPGYVVDSGVLNGVSKVVLPAGGFYDTVTVTAVPEPSTWALAGVGLAALIWQARRKSQA